MRNEMSSLPRRRLLAAAAGAASVAAAGTLWPVHAADAFPGQPVKLIVTFGAGGVADVVTRLVGNSLAAELGQPVVIDNRPGASGAIGARAASLATADGYTLMIGTPSTQVINPMIYSKLPYDPWTAFVPVSLLAEAPVLLSMRPMAGVSDLAGLVRHARAHPGKLTFGSAGVGTTPHLGMELFKLATGTDIVHVPYKSGGEAVNAVISGQVDLIVEAAAVVGPFLKAGQLKALAAAGPRRSTALPDLPTAAEPGLKDFEVTAPWFGIAAPAGTPKERVDVLAGAAARAMAGAELRQRLQERGIEVLPSGAAAYQSLLEKERRDWQRVVKAAQVTAD